jgi:hypothetical protein
MKVIVKVTIVLVRQVSRRFATKDSLVGKQWVACMRSLQTFLEGHTNQLSERNPLDSSYLLGTMLEVGRKHNGRPFHACIIAHA